LFWRLSDIVARRYLVKISALKMTDQSRKGGFGLFGATALLCLPSLFSVYSSSEIASSGGSGSSGLWFMFQVSEYVGVIGIVVGAALVVMEITEGKISRIAIGLMTASVFFAIFLQWYAIHIYRSPWF
jgi:surface polysaccharide O-acyltransferase-like enzyme